MIPALDQLLHARTGPMTSELVLRPADFGLGRVPARLAPAATTTSICGFCSTGCSLTVHVDTRGEAINLTPDPRYPVNRGMACPKGWEALTPLAAPDRATVPLRRDAAGALVPVSWPEALATFADRIRSIQSRHGPASLAILSTGQIVMEEMALLGALAKFGLGVRDLDSNTRQCMATTHVAYRESFGFDAPPFTYADFEESDVLVFVGANPCIAHPILWQRVMNNRRSPRIVVLDPRRTETAQAATHHFPLRPKSDLTLLYALARELIARDAVDRVFVDKHTTGFAAFARFVQPFTLERAAAESGLATAELIALADLVGDRSQRVSWWWTMGVNQSHQSTRTAQAIINLALLTGQIGRPGTGPNSITGQCNAMGSRLFGNATSLLGGRDFADPAARAHVARLLDLDPERIPTAKSRAYDQILDAIETGEIRALWVVATDPAHSWIEPARWAALRERLEFLVVQDMYATTSTARTADLVLPAAGWGEKEGTFINSERRIGVVRKVARAPGQALSDFAIFRLVAQACGCADLFRRWESPAAAFQILKELSRGQPCDFTGVRDYDHLAASGGIQWPYRDGGSENAQNGAQSADAACAVAAAAPSERRLFADGRFFTPDGRARFVFDAPRPLPEAPDAAFPLLLLTGRGSSAQWHTGSRTDKSAVLRKLAPRGTPLEIHPDDAARHGIADGAPVRVRSRRGAIDATAMHTRTVRPGQVFLAMHDPAVNRLAFPAFDPHSRQPAYKACAVAVTPR